MTLYIEHFLTLIFEVTVCISVSALASLLNVFKRIMSSTTRLNICAIISRIKKYKSIIKKKKKKHYKIALLAKTTLDCKKSSFFNKGIKRI